MLLILCVLGIVFLKLFVHVILLLKFQPVEYEQSQLPLFAFVHVQRQQLLILLLRV